MNLECGMYVRTNEGIGTVQRIYNNKNDCTVKFKKGHVKKWVTILKASHNIIDLIEPMDLMYIDISPDDCGGIVVPRVAETLNELEEWKKRFSNGSCVLKEIVTREQLERMVYKI